MELLNRAIANKEGKRPLKILQFGGGNFLRAFTDWMVDILNEETDFNGDVVIVKPTERGDYSALRNQNGLFHVLLNGIKDGEAVNEKRLVSCVQEVIHPYQEWGSFLETATNPDLKFIISNTTESGIKFTPEDFPDDRSSSEFPAKLTAWLFHRFNHFKGDTSKTCIFLPLELIEQNGVKLRNCILKYASHWSLSTAFIDWFNHSTFCNSLVDRIVSGFPSNDKEAIEQELGVRDELLVTGELYHSWIIEGPEWIKNELPFHQTALNVKFVNDLDIHRKIKVRILNGAHTSMVPIGFLHGIETVGEFMQEDYLSEFIRAELINEIIPTIDYDQTELLIFAEDVLDRFRNPAIRHKLLDIALNSTSKFTTRLLPTLLDYQDNMGKLPLRIVYAFASLIQFYSGVWNGKNIPLRDDAKRIQTIANIWNSSDLDLPTISQEILSLTNIWGSDLNEIPQLTKQVASYLETFRVSPPLSLSTFEG